nr:unnamed protein product [Callosobruchus analis]
MGVSWLAQVRCVHLALFALAMIPLFICLSYLNTEQLHTTISPLRTFEIRLQHSNNTHSHSPSQSQSQSERISPPAAAVKHASETAEAPSVPVLSHISNASSSNNQGSDMAKGVSAGMIYEAGHADVNSQICPNLGQNLKLLIAITIRKDVAIAFILGLTSNQTLNNNIEKEQEIYGDIIRGKFIDTYDNLTLKTISVLEWVDNYCSKASFVLKTDDDMFINVSRLLAFIAKHKPETRAIYGRLAKKWKPIRNKISKYYISPQQYKPPVFPDFTTGMYVILTQIYKY